MVFLRGRLSKTNWRSSGFLLSMVSPVIHKQLCGNFLEGHQKRIEICDVNEMDFRAVLDLWCGKLDCECDELEKVMQLASIADRFEITDLSLTLEAVIQRLLTVDNCCKLLAWSSRNGLRILHTAARSLALERFEELAGTAGFLQIDEDILDSLINDDELVVTGEESVFGAVVEWFKARERSHTSLKLLCSIRFLQIPNVNEYFDSTVLKWVSGNFDLIQDFADYVIRSNSDEYFIEVGKDDCFDFQLAQPFTDFDVLESSASVLAKYDGAWYAGQVQTRAADGLVPVVFKGYEEEGPVATDAAEVTPNREVLAKKYGDDCRWLKGQVVGTDCDGWVLVSFEGDDDEPQKTEPLDVRVVLNSWLDDDEIAGTDAAEFRACAEGLKPAMLWLLLRRPRNTGRRRRLQVDWANAKVQSTRTLGESVLAIAECEQLIYVGSSDGNLAAWSAQTLEYQRQLHDGFSPIAALAVFQGRLVSAHGSGKLRVWNARTGACEQVVEPDTYGRPHVCVFVVAGTANAGARLVGGCADGSLMLWAGGDALPLALESTKRRGQAAVSALAAWRGTVLSGHRDGAISVWDVEGGTTLSCRSAVTALAVHGDVLYSATADGMIREWEAGSWAPLRAAEGCRPERPGAYCLSMAVSGSKLVVCSDAAARGHHEVRRAPAQATESAQGQRWEHSPGL